MVWVYISIFQYFIKCTRTTTVTRWYVYESISKCGHLKFKLNNDFKSSKLLHDTVDTGEVMWKSVRWYMLAVLHNFKTNFCSLGNPWQGNQWTKNGKLHTYKQNMNKVKGLIICLYTNMLGQFTTPWGGSCSEVNSINYCHSRNYTRC
jgi:hypothetical protein